MQVLWDALQQIQIEQLKSDVEMAKYDASKMALDATDRHVRILAQQVETLTLMCHAMWTLLQERHGLTDADLFARFNELDLRDGTRDGRFRPPPQPCPTCNGMVNARIGKCLTCGTVTGPQTPF